MNKKDIIHQAIEQLKMQTPFELTYRIVNESDRDAIVLLGIHGKTIQCNAIGRTEVKPYQVEGIVKAVKKMKNGLVIAHQIYPAVKELLQEQGVAYLDVAGNTFIGYEKQYIFIKGNKNNMLDLHLKTTNRAFTKTGLKMVFYLLLHDEAIGQTYRALATATGVALGNVKNIIDGLKDAGYIIQKDQSTLLLINKKELLARWIEGYQETLQPSLLIGQFKNIFPLTKQDALLYKGDDLIIGGEYAAELLTNYIKADCYTLYSGMAKIDLMKQFRLIPDPNGTLKVYQTFWKDYLIDVKNQKLAPALLIYADLMMTRDSRCMETAVVIFEKYLKNDFK